MKKQYIALLVALTVVLSGFAGFGGTYLAQFYFGADAMQARQYDELAYSSNPSIADLAVGSSAPLGADPAGAIAALSGADSAGGEIMAGDEPSMTMQNNGIYADNETDTNDTTDTNENFTIDDTAYDFSLLSMYNAPDANTSQPLSIPEIAALASGSVVEIYTESVISSGRMGQFVTEGAGSGVIIAANGYIVTNNHVIEGSSKITVRLNDIDYNALLIGRDSKTDLAVIKIEASGLQPAIFGNPEKVVVGELAVAIGNPLGELGGTVTDGIISALSRNIDIDGHMMTLLQTSAAVNPGNSGGGLFNGYGELIGVVNAKSSGSDIEGIGFAIPVNIVKSVSDALMQYGYVPGRIDFGATLINVLDARTAMMYRLQSTGVYVSQADSDSPLQSGDRIISINGANITNEADVKALLENCNVGDVLSIILSRNGSATTVNLTLKQAHS